MKGNQNNNNKKGESILNPDHEAMVFRQLQKVAKNGREGALTFFNLAMCCSSSHPSRFTMIFFFKFIF
jgi:hypothetical protein